MKETTDDYRPCSTVNMFSVLGGLRDLFIRMRVRVSNLGWKITLASLNDMRMGSG